MILFTASCSFPLKTPEPQIIDVTPTQIIIPGELNEIIEYYNFIQDESDIVKKQKFEDIKKDFTDNHDNVVNRLKYALLLATPRTSFHNRNMAIKLLNDWPQLDQSESSLYGFRNILLGFLTEQQRTQNTINNLSKQLKVEQQRVIKLQKIVSDIKDMEKNLYRRNLN